MRNRNSVTGIVRRTPDNAILIARKCKGRFRSYWELPGGKMEDGEDPAHRLIKELYDELGVGIEIETQGPMVIHHFTDERDEIVRMYLHSFFCRVIYGALTLHEHDRVQWILEPELLLTYRLTPSDALLVRKMIAELRGNSPREIYC